MEYKIQSRTDYSKELFCYKRTIPIGYYSRRQMKTLYPHGNFMVAGEIGSRAGTQCGTAEDADGRPLPVYKVETHNSLTEAVVGFAAIDSHTYLAVVKNDLPRRILALVLVLALTGIGAIVVFKYYIR